MLSNTNAGDFSKYNRFLTHLPHLLETGLEVDTK